MRNMTVFRIANIAVMVFFAVFLNLTAGSDQNRIKSSDLLADRIEERIFFVARVRQRERVGKGFPNESLIEGAARSAIMPPPQMARHPLHLLRRGRIFWRGRRFDQKQLAMRHQRFGVKPAQREHRRVGHLIEEGLILRKLIIFHQQLGGKPARPCT